MTDVQHYRQSLRYHPKLILLPTKTHYLVQRALVTQKRRRRRQKKQNKTKAEKNCVKSNNESSMGKVRNLVGREGCQQGGVGGGKDHVATGFSTIFARRTHT